MIRTLVILFVEVCAISLCAAAEKPNIFFFFADDWDCTAGVYADPQRPSLSDIVKTPNIDRMGREGVIFDNAFVQVSSCGPSRASLTTGRSFWRNGSRAFKGGDHFKRDNDPYTDLPRFPDLLRESGYHVDKFWKTIDFEVSKGVELGPDNPYAKLAKVPRYGLYVSEAKSESERVKRHQEVVDATRNMFRHTMAKVPPDQPFFFIFGPINTHRPYAQGSGQKIWNIDPDAMKGRIPVFIPDVPETRGDFADYAGEIQALDLMLGVFLEEMKSMGILDNTLVILSGDNGMPGVPRGKTTCYDLGVKAPLLMRLPGTIKPGRRVTDFVTLSDLAPTLLEFAGLDIPETMDAKSFLAQVKSEKSGWIDPARDHVFTGRERHKSTIAREGFLPYPIRAVRSKDYLYIRNFKSERLMYGDEKYSYGDVDSSPTKSFILSNKDNPAINPLYKMHFEQQPEELLFRIDKDPYSMNNLAGNPEMKEVLDYYRTVLNNKLENTGDPRLQDAFDRMPWVGVEDGSQSSK